MNILRGIAASLLTSVFLTAVLITALLWGMLATLTVGPLDKALSASRVGERLPALFAVQLSPMFEKLPLTPKGFTANQLVAEAFPSAQVESLLKKAVNDNLSYIRGESALTTPVDLLPLFSNMKTALIAHLPASVGKKMADNMQSSIAAQGLDKGLIIPADKLVEAKEGYAAFRLAAYIALLALFIILGLIFLVAPHGIRGRLKYAGIAALVAGTVAAALGAGLTAIVGVAISQLDKLPSSASAGAASSGTQNMPPQVLAMIKDLVPSLASSLGAKVFIYGSAIAVLGLGCLIAMAFIKSGSRAQKPLPQLRTLPSEMNKK